MLRSDRLIQANQPQVHLLCLNAAEELVSTTLFEYDYLDAGELAKAHQYRNESARRQFLAGRYLAKTILAAATQQTRDSIQLQLAPNGKPYLENSAWHFNLSHSGDWVACALAPRAIGIDIEARLRSIEHLAIAEQHFSSEEFSWLRKRQAKQNQKFTALWSLKEAYLKALGLGISHDLASMRWQLHGKSSIAVQSSFTTQPWFCRLLRPDSGYWLSLCYPEQLGAVAIYKHSLSTLCYADLPLALSKS